MVDVSSAGLLFRGTGRETSVLGRCDRRLGGLRARDVAIQPGPVCQVDYAMVNRSRGNERNGIASRPKATHERVHGAVGWRVEGTIAMIALEHLH